MWRLDGLSNRKEPSGKKGHVRQLPITDKTLEEKKEGLCGLLVSGQH